MMFTVVCCGICLCRSKRGVLSSQVFARRLQAYNVFMLTWHVFDHRKYFPNIYMIIHYSDMGAGVLKFLYVNARNKNDLTHHHYCITMFT